ncbi:NAC domain-containing protein JA2L-like isoform X2 [Salvia miltiorrhiza]|uniref:NAC domain-containing protein JA2L-like isoform X2 n=1 Tax=Salvia miltiorrhiza TaxID=226208 RepID=UPI0025AD18DE|nr:NAC domain-containing protein JA2L-like isoform X2 [Salvia miltiorrhiza]
MSDSEKYLPGFEFVPRDNEIILEYLMKKINNEALRCSRIYTVQFYASTPDDLSQRFRASRDQWFFFTLRVVDRAVAGGGYWEPITSETHIMHNDERIGSRITLAYFAGKPQESTETDWLMQEFRVMNSSTTQQNSMRLDEWVVCKVCKRSGNAGRRMMADVDGEDYYTDMEFDSASTTQSNLTGVDSASTFEITDFDPSTSSGSTNLEQNTVGNDNKASKAAKNQHVESSHLISTARSLPSYHQQVPSFASESHYGTEDYHSQLQVQQGHDQLDVEVEYASSSSSSCDPSP